MRFWFAVLLASIAGPVVAQPAKLPTDPIPRLEADGPTAAVTAMAFSPDARTLYAAGFDKVVRVWRFDETAKTFKPDSAASLRVPIGPGRAGVINLLAVSPDGKRVAAAGLGVYRGAAGFADRGWVVADNALSLDMRKDRSQITLFDVKTQAVSLLRGHDEDVLGLAFAPAVPGQPQLLVSLARRNGPKPGTFAGRVSIWNADNADVLNADGELVEKTARTADWQLLDVPGGEDPNLIVERNAERCRIIVAWRGIAGKLRVWDVEPNGKPRADTLSGVLRENATAPDFLGLAAGIPGGFVTGGGAGPGGYLLPWSGNDTPTAGEKIALSPPEGQPWVMPYALAPLASRTNQLPDRGFLVLFGKPTPQGVPYYFTLMTLGDKPDTTKLRSLGISTVPPVVAASPDGQFLAITRRSRQEIRVYPAATLIDGGLEPERLAGGGRSFNAVAFLRKAGANDSVGLLLGKRTNRTAGAAPELEGDDLVFDLPGRTLAAKPGGAAWEIARPTDWSATQPNRGEFDWSGPVGKAGKLTVTLSDRQSVTDFVLLPPVKPLTAPLLAVAVWDAAVNESKLTLFDTASGAAVRWCQGHAGMIRALAASPDGRLLASASDDQTVALWGLTDLDETVGQRATIPGVILSQRNAQVLVARVEGTSVLQPADAIQSVAFGKAKPRPVTSAKQLLQDVWQESPSDRITVTVLRGGEEMTLEVPLAQGQDERKPLVSLFVTDALQWVAWTPLGPFDSSGRDAERHLGFQFNPDRLGGAVRFPKMEEYRQPLRREGLLAALANRANLSDALQDLTPRVPKTDLRLRIVPGTVVGSGVLVRKPRVQLQIAVDGASLADDQVDSVTWELDRGVPSEVRLDRAVDQSLVQDIELRERGIYRVRVRLRTKEANPQDVVRELLVRYQPPPPVVAFQDVPPKRPVEKADFTVRGTVTRGTADEAVELVLKQNGRTESLGTGTDFAKTIPLDPGENVIAVVARNKNAMKGYEDAETSTERPFVVVFGPRPEVRVTQVIPLGGVALDATPGVPVEVGVPRVRILGKIAAAEPLTAATRDGTPLKRFRERAEKTFEFDEEVELKPVGPKGEPQLLSFKARTVSSEEVGEAKIGIVFRPELPRLDLLQPDDDMIVLKGAKADELTVRGSLTPAVGLPPEKYPFQVVVRAFGPTDKRVLQDGRDEVVIDADALTKGEAGKREFEQKLRLEPGRNRVEVLLRSEWRSDETLMRKIVRNVVSRVPARVVSVQPARPADKGAADLTIKVLSAEKPNLWIDVQQQKDAPGAGKPINYVVVVEGTDQTPWELLVKFVVLKPGQNWVRVRASSDGEWSEPLAIEYKPPTKIDIAGLPDQGLSVRAREFLVEFQVRSTGGPFVEVAVYDGTKLLKAMTADAIEELTRESDGSRTLSAKIGPVALREGPNALRIVVADAKVRTERMLDVAYTPPPLRVEDVVISTPDATGRVAVTGRIAWTKVEQSAAIDRQLQQGMQVFAGARAYRPDITVAGESARNFAARVPLTERAENVIELSFPGLPIDGERRFVRDCPTPAKLQGTLHLLVVAPGVADGEALAKKVLESVGAEGFQSRTFPRVVMHPFDPGQRVRLLYDYVTAAQVRTAFDSLRSAASPNDVVLVYWNGRVESDSNKRWLRTGESQRERWVALNEVLELPRKVPAACVFLIDGIGEPIPASELMDTRMAVVGWASSRKDSQLLLDAVKSASAVRELAQPKVKPNGSTITHNPMAASSNLILHD